MGGDGIFIFKDNRGAKTKQNVNPEINIEKTGRYKGYADLKSILKIIDFKKR